MDLYQLNALDIIKLLKSKEISPLDCLSSLQKRISSVNKQVNALVTLCFERAEVNAKKLIESGADVLVAGSFVFNSKDPLNTIKDLKEI